MPSNGGKYENHPLLVLFYQSANNSSVSFHVVISDVIDSSNLWRQSNHRPRLPVQSTQETRHNNWHKIQRAALPFSTSVVLFLSYLLHWWCGGTFYLFPVWASDTLLLAIVDLSMVHIFISFASDPFLSICGYSLKYRSIIYSFRFVGAIRKNHVEIYGHRNFRPLSGLLDLVRWSFSTSSAINARTILCRVTKDSWYVSFMI